jgi:hypothetical protein
MKAFLEDGQKLKTLPSLSIPLGIKQYPICGGQTFRFNSEGVYPWLFRLGQFLGILVFTITHT